MVPQPTPAPGGDANLYRYAGNDPVNGVDPTGLEGIDTAGVGLFSDPAAEKSARVRRLTGLAERAVLAGDAGRLARIQNVLSNETDTHPDHQSLVRMQTIAERNAAGSAAFWASVQSSLVVPRDALLGLVGSDVNEAAVVSAILAGDQLAESGRLVEVAPGIYQMPMEYAPERNPNYSFHRSAAAIGTDPLTYLPIPAGKLGLGLVRAKALGTLVSVPRTTGGPAYKTWNQFQSGTAGQFASRAEAASAWRIYKEANGIVTGTTRSPAVARQFLKSLADDYRTPSWMKQWLREGRRPPGYEIDHIKPLSIGGDDLPSNMRLQGIGLHDTHHSYYRPWEW